MDQSLYYFVKINGEASPFINKLAEFIRINIDYKCELKHRFLSQWIRLFAPSFGEDDVQKISKEFEALVISLYEIPATMTELKIYNNGELERHLMYSDTAWAIIKGKKQDWEEKTLFNEDVYQEHLNSEYLDQGGKARIKEMYSAKELVENEGFPFFDTDIFAKVLKLPGYAWDGETDAAYWSTEYDIDNKNIVNAKNGMHIVKKAPYDKQADSKDRKKNRNGNASKVLSVVHALKIKLIYLHYFRWINIASFLLVGVDAFLHTKYLTLSAIGILIVNTAIRYLILKP
jgi:hypothetical protein